MPPTMVGPTIRRLARGASIRSDKKERRTGLTTTRRDLAMAGCDNIGMRSVLATRLFGAVALVIGVLLEALRHWPLSAPTAPT